MQAEGLDATLHQPLALQLLEEAVEHARLGPAAHARVQGVQGAVVPRCRPMFTAVGGHLEDGVDHLEIVQSRVAALPRWRGSSGEMRSYCSRVDCITLITWAPLNRLSSKPSRRPCWRWAAEGRPNDVMLVGS